MFNFFISSDALMSVLFYSIKLNQANSIFDAVYFMGKSFKQNAF